MKCWSAPDMPELYLNGPEQVGNTFFWTVEAACDNPCCRTLRREEAP